MYVAYISITTKSYARGAQWYRVHEDKETADTLPELKKKLQSRYGKSWKHKKPMYCDTKTNTVRTGWIVGFRAEDQDRSAPDGTYRYLEQDWVSIRQETSSRIQWPVGQRGPL